MASFALARPQLGRTVFLACDLQTAFTPLISNFPRVLASSSFLIEGAKALQAPLLVTEQVPEKLGHTVPELDVSSAVEVVAKAQFSMATETLLQACAKHVPCDSDVSVVHKDTGFVLFGIETHVCVLQTALDLRRRGHSVFVACDAVSSQRLDDRHHALNRMQQAGCVLTTAESVLFEIMCGSEHPAFRTISKLAKQHQRNVKDLGPVCPDSAL
ncbi:MAG: hypothetical protein MHM6MM_001375 [Cercozoa sp. M6MM]